MQAGDALPALKLTAEVSGRTIDTAALTTPTVFVFHGVKTQDAPKDIGKAVRAHFPEASDAYVVNVTNLKKMGGLWQKVAVAQLKSTYERMAAKVPEGKDPTEYVIMVPDWTNEIGPQFGFDNSDAKAGAVIANSAGEVLGVATGEELGNQVLELLKAKGS